MGEVILSDDLGMAICKAMGIDTENVQRIVIDLKPCEPIHVTIKMAGIDTLSDVDYSDLANAKVKIIGAE